MKYFNNVKTMDELKREYRRLVMIHHPDVGGDTATMQQINAEHDAIFEQLKAAQNTRAASDPTGKTRTTTETAEEFREIIVALLALDGLEVELCGRWLWVGGNTKEHKDRLKALGLKWCSKKKLWSWHHPEEGSRSHKSHDMGYIRSKYGSETITGSPKGPGPKLTDQDKKGE
jgi:hypothetical protein